MATARKPIAIVTGWSPALGSGHLQRMLSLLWYLDRVARRSVVLVARGLPDSFPTIFRPFLKKVVPEQSELIIRDMRDSTPREITALKKRGPVIVIDDAGAGRACANRAIDLLPNPETGASESGAFIYGWGFVESLGTLIDGGKSEIKKDIDCAIYPGAAAEDARVTHLLSLLPRDARCAVLRGNESYTVVNGKRVARDDETYAHLLFSSKAFLSHFGIALYEAHVAQCRLITLNPTPYHSKLADMARSLMPIDNCGVESALDEAALRGTMAALLRKKTARSVRIRTARDMVMSHMDAACRVILSAADAR